MSATHPEQHHFELRAKRTVFVVEAAGSRREIVANASRRQRRELERQQNLLAQDALTNYKSVRVSRGRHTSNDSEKPRV